ncbi:MAG: NAD(P)-dependent oxidoreductase [Planctomycetes bacterium]|nr:NAD(P)-dependent oxidoreductase [Planctomycetota bacterium]
MATTDEHFSVRERGAVWVTGGAGFIGRALTAALEARGIATRCVDHRLPPRADSPHSVAQMCTEAVRAELERARSVVHLASRVGVRTVVRDPAAVGAENRASARALVEALAPLPFARRPRVLSASTSEVYRPANRPLGEDDPLRGVDENGRWSYAASKVEAERILDAAHLWEPARGAVHLRFFNVVGPGQDSAQGMVLPIFVEHALRGLPIPVHGDGSAVRTLAHVDDVAATLCALIEHAHLPAGPLNVGGTARASVLEIAECVLALSGSRAGIVRVDPKETVGAAFEDIAWREPDLTRLAALGVPVPSRSLEAIVRDTLARHEALKPRRETCGSRAS